MSFYDDWLKAGSEIDSAFAGSPGVSRDADRPWVETRHDPRVKMMLSDDLGFPTMGGALLKAELPSAWHTGVHSHGEEGIFVISGSGFVVVDGHRFDIRAGSTLQIPYRAAHQLVNTSSQPLLYVSGLAFPLERFVKLARLEQIQDHGPNDERLLSMPALQSSSLPSGRRVLIHLDEAPTDEGQDDSQRPMAYRKQHGRVHYLALPENGFPAPTSVAVTHVFEEPPGHHGGRHKHLEAVLYVLEGEGYSDVGDEASPWGPGDVLHVPPAMYEHEHFNQSDKTSRMLRIQYGIRYWFTQLWPEGYSPQRVFDAAGRPMEAGAIKSER